MKGNCGQDQYPVRLSVTVQLKLISPANVFVFVVVWGVFVPFPLLVVIKEVK